jgi:hypothetical protein
MGNIFSTKPVPTVSVQLEPSFILQYEGPNGPADCKLEKPTIVQMPQGLRVLCENESKKEFVSKYNFINDDAYREIASIPDYLTYYLVTVECSPPVPNLWSNQMYTILPAQTRIIPMIGETFALNKDTMVHLLGKHKYLLSNMEMVILPGTKLLSVDDQDKIIIVKDPIKAKIAEFKGWR